MNLKYWMNQSTFGLIRLLNAPFYHLSRLSASSYQIFTPASTYAPWLRDEAFLKVFNRVKQDSLVNFYQAYDLWKHVEEAEKVEGDVLEVGVWRGSTAVVMAHKLQQLRSPKHLYACDTFEGVVKPNRALDNVYEGGEHDDVSFEDVKALVHQRFGLTNTSLIKGVFPDEVAHQLNDKQFSLCHIDVDTYTSAKEAVDWIWKRLTTGGTIIFNDYGFPGTQGITTLVNEYRDDPDKLVIYNFNGNGVVIKIG